MILSGSALLMDTGALILQKNDLLRSFLLILISFVCQNSKAGLLIDINQFLSGSNCVPKIQGLAKSWGSAGDWREDFNDKNEVLAVKSPTQKIGVWIVLEKDPFNRQVRATRLSPHTELRVNWSKDCDANLEKVEVKGNDQSLSTDNLDDELLQKIIDKKTDGLIYAFSPFMHLSIEGIPTAISLAKQKNLPLTIVIDPGLSSDLKLWRTKIDIKSENVLVLRSRELVMRGMGIHYPSLIVYSKKGSFSGVYPGRQSQEVYSKYIQDFLK